MTAVVVARQVAKKFTRSLGRSMRYGVQDMGREILGLGVASESLRDGEFWAVDGVDFEVRRGETLGVIGGNGSGKSTLLKMLNGIYRPDRGRIGIQGNVGALIEVGAGFHPMLTGRENIYINGAILGMGKGEIDRKFDSIVDFAEIGEFLDSPVRHYSSGMYVRLGFAIAIHSEPDVLLVDEILAVGDLHFQNKCHERMLEINDRAAVLLVSHNLAAVSMLCDRVLWLESGRCRMLDSPDRVIAQYTESMFARSTEERARALSEGVMAASGELHVDGIDFVGADGVARTGFRSGEKLTIRCRYRATRDLGRPYFQLDVRTPRGYALFGASMIADGRDRAEVFAGPGFVECRFGELPLQPGTYVVDLNVRPDSGAGKLYRQLYAATFRIDEAGEASESTGRLATYRERLGGALKLPYEWHQAGAAGAIGGETG